MLYDVWETKCQRDKSTSLPSKSGSCFCNACSCSIQEPLASFTECKALRALSSMQLSTQRMSRGNHLGSSPRRKQLQPCHAYSCVCIRLLLQSVVVVKHTNFLQVKLPADCVKPVCAYLKDAGTVPCMRLFSNLREVIFGILPISGGIVPVSCKHQYMESE